MGGQDLSKHTRSDIEEAVQELEALPVEVRSAFTLDFSSLTPELLEQLRQLHPTWFEPNAVTIYWWDPGESQEGPETGM